MIYLFHSDHETLGESALLAELPGDRVYIALFFERTFQYLWMGKTVDREIFVNQ